MAIYDCFQYFNEDHIVDLRFNILDKFVDYFVISESTKTHQGKPKQINFDIKKFSKFKNKIIFVKADYKEEINFEKNRFLRASAVIAVLFKPVSHPKIPLWEMELSTGAVCSNILVAAQSLGYAAQWLTEWYSYNDKMIMAVGGKPKTDKLAGFIYIGDKEKEPVERRRPKKEKVIKFLTE